MCDILKPLEQGCTAQAQSSTPQLVSAGAEATEAVAAIMETHPYGDHATTSEGDASQS